MFTEADGVIFQTLYNPTTDPAATADCAVTEIASANFTCGTCFDATDRGLPAPVLSVKYSCKILGTDEIADGLTDPATVAALDTAFVGFVPAVTAPITIGEPSVNPLYVTVVVRIAFAAQLDAAQEAAAKTTVGDSLAESTGQDVSFFTEEIFFVGEDGTKRSAEAVQAFLYDVVVTISGAAQMAASALMALVFLALFI
jgi:hypothetical protein